MNTLSSAGPGSPLCCLSRTVGPPQMGRHSLLLPQGAVLPAPPSKCCLQHPLPRPNSHTVFSLSGGLAGNL